MRWGLIVGVLATMLAAVGCTSEADEGASERWTTRIDVPPRPTVSPLPDGADGPCDLADVGAAERALGEQLGRGTASQGSSVTNDQAWLAAHCNWRLDSGARVTLTMTSAAALAGSCPQWELDRIDHREYVDLPAVGESALFRWTVEGTLFDAQLRVCAAGGMVQADLSVPPEIEWEREPEQLQDALVGLAGPAIGSFE